MKIIVDNREKALIQQLQNMNKDNNCTHTMEVAKLDLGDVIIKDQNDDEILILERKQLADLASSIRDGRYAEQSYRLNGYSLHNHNIIYIIEGGLHSYSDRFTKITPDTLLTSMFSLNYYKGFSVFRTFNLNETAKFILLITDKLRRESDKGGFYPINKMDLAEQSGDNYGNKNYSEVVKKVKKDNITTDNIGAIILSQIPGISSKTAEIIMAKYHSLFTLMITLESNNSCLDNLSYETAGGQIRRISKTAINNIIKYLICNDDTAIKIAT